MALTTSKTTYLNGNSKKGDRILANFSANISKNGPLNINETIIVSESQEIVSKDFSDFQRLASKLQVQEDD